MPVGHCRFWLGQELVVVVVVVVVVATPFFFSVHAQFENSSNSTHSYFGGIQLLQLRRDHEGNSE